MSMIDREEAIRIIASYPGPVDKSVVRRILTQMPACDQLATNLQPTCNWIPVTEKLPEHRDWFLGVFKEQDTGWINPIPFVCDYIGRDTGVTTVDFWLLKEHDCTEAGFEYYRNLTCVAWMPLPDPYEGGEQDV